MKTIFRQLLAVSTLLALQATGMASTVIVEVGTVQAAAGAKVDLPINLKGSQKLGAMQLELAYDPAVLETQDDQIEKGTFPADISLGTHVVTPGLVRMVMNAGASESISGDGQLMRASFTVKGQAGQSCDLRITSVRAWDNIDPKAVPAEMLVTVQQGKFTVGGGLPWWSMIVAGVLLLLVLLLLLRKKRPHPVAAAHQ